MKSKYVSENKVVSSITIRTDVEITIVEVTRAFSNAQPEDQSKILTLVAQQMPPDMVGDSLGELASRIQPNGIVHLWLLALAEKIVACERAGASQPVE